MQQSHVTHYLKTNETNERPQHMLFLDTETYESAPKVLDEKSGRSIREQTFKLGWVAYLDLHHVDRERPAVTYTRLNTIEDFYTELYARAKPKQRLYLFAHNVNFDAQIVGLHIRLTKDGWECLRNYIGPSKVILQFRKDKCTILVLDTLNLFNTSLAEMGETLGYPKGHVDFKTVGMEELSTYCKNDVTIMVEFMQKWLSFLDDNDLGGFKSTIASQAMAAYRHRFMSYPLLVHTYPELVELERQAYYGGRVEAGYVGTAPKVPYYYLDVNSLYPTVMQQSLFPTEPFKHLWRPAIEILNTYVDNYIILAECTIKTPIPIVPVKTEDGPIWPIGTFQTTLIGEEVAECLKRGYIVKVKQARIYKSSPIFKSYVDTMYALRKKYIEDGNKSYGAFVKLLLNCLYGKFGQKMSGWEQIGDCGPNELWVKTVLKSDGSKVMRRAIAGRIEENQELGNTDHTIVAIAASVTAAARMYMWRLRELLPEGSFMYMDTDSLIVDEIGYQALADMVTKEKILGKLKIEGVSEELIIRCPKDYRFNGIDKIKGVSHNAVKIDNKTFMVDEWLSINSAMRYGKLDRGFILTIRKVLQRIYKKGVVLPGGRVTPFVYPLS